jgi:hypothetical protein
MRTAAHWRGYELTVPTVSGFSHPRVTHRWHSGNA